MLKNLVKAIIPKNLLQQRRRRIAEKEQSRFAEKSISETFTEIYENNVWGGKKGEYFSGNGSAEKYARAYAETIKNFIATNKIEKVVDLGCGDFRVASTFVSPDIEYTGIDVVAPLIEHHRKKFATEKIRFLCKNVVEDELPAGDLCLIRQVLQHLSNAEIEKILRNVRDFKYLIVTEHYPNPHKNIVPNLDIAHGPDIRLHFDSAVYLDEPPFNLRNVSVLLDVEADEGTRIKTFVIKQ